MNIDTIRNVHSVRVCNGSGVIVRPLEKSYLYILTNYHVLFEDDGQAKTLKFKFEKGSPLNVDNINVIGDPIYSKDKDIAIIKIDANGFENVEFLRLNICCSDAKIHVGFSKARYEGAVSLTQVLNIQNINGHANNLLTEYEYTKPVAENEIKGMSGGGVFDEDCCLVGIHKQSSNKDEEELLGNACFISITYYKEILKEKGWSPILEFNLDSFIEFTELAFNFDNDSFIRNMALELLLSIEDYKEKLNNYSPQKVLDILKQNGRLAENISIDYLNQDFWVDFTEFVIGVISILEINLDTEDFILSIYDKFHYVYGTQSFDFMEVRERLDVDLITGFSQNAKLIVGGLPSTTFKGCVLTSKVPNIAKGKIYDVRSISRPKRIQLMNMTIINAKIFNKGVIQCVEGYEDVNIQCYRELILSKIS